MDHAPVGEMAAVKAQIFQSRQGSKVNQPGIAHTLSSKIQFFQPGESSEMTQAGVGDLTGPYAPQIKTFQ